jgi:hypothetical protein
MTEFLGTDSGLQILEHIVTIVGVAFVALQLFLQTRQLQQGNYLAVMQSRTDITEREIANPSLMAVYDLNLSFPKIVSLADWNALTEQQKVLYFHLGTLVSQQERAITLLSRYPADMEGLEAEQVALRELAGLPIFKMVWPYMSKFYSLKIVQFVGGIA